MTGGGPILFAWGFDGQGGGSALAGEDISRTLRADALAWVHLDATHPDTRGWLQREVNYLDELILDALLAGETRPRYAENGEGVLLILRGMNLNEGADPEDMVSMRLWIDAHRIISLERRRLKAVRDIGERLQQGHGPGNAGDFLVQVAARLFERMEPVLSALDEETDTLEEKIMDHPDPSERQAIVAIRRQAILFRRYISPQRDVIQAVRTLDMPWLSTAHRRHLQESHDRLIRYVEDLDAIRERAQIIKDELVNALSDRLNRNMYILSVIAAVFLPLGFLTGLLGVNVGGIPGSDNPDAFMIFSVALLVLVAGQVALFRKLKWF